MRKLDRRTFVIGAGGAVLAGASPASVFSQVPPGQVPPGQVPPGQVPPGQVPPGQVPPGLQPTAPQLAVRRSIATMPPDDPVIAAYRLAVERMKALPATDPRNWSRLAQIHVDFCPHGNWFFLPWHRAYLVSFERICRQVLNDPTFALPYWDWTELRQLPPAFTEATVNGRPNSLFDSGRQLPPATAMPSSAVAQDTILRIMAETQFENFGSTRPLGQSNTDARWLRVGGTMTQLEATPHGTVHATIGGNMGGFSSPLDPIFYLHHCNIDRLWAWWNGLGRRNGTDRLWTTFRFDGIFQTPRGQGLTTFNVAVSDMLDHQRWGYTYLGVPGNPADIDPWIAPQDPNGPPPGDPNAPVAFNGPPGASPAGSPIQPGGSIPPAGAIPGAGAVAPGGGVQVASADAGLPQVLAVEAGKGSAGLDRVMSTRLNLQEILTETPLIPENRTSARRPEADIGSSTARDATAILRESPLEQGGGTPASKPATTKPTAQGPTPVATREGRIFTVLENMKASGASTLTVNVFLNHPNPTARTSTDDPHFVGTFGLFGLQGHMAHDGASVQFELTNTLTRLRQANIPVGKQLEVQLIPVGGYGTAPELTNPARVRIIRM
jgi:hypothetical protein